jgi:hypothetical protein
MLKIGWLSKAIAAHKSGCTKISKAKEETIRNQFIEMGKEDQHLDRPHWTPLPAEKETPCA